MVKRLSLFLVFCILILNLPVFGTGNTLEDTLGFNLLTGEASFAITKDMDLSAFNTAVSSSGYSVVWSSDKEYVIRIEEDTAKVIRQDEDTTVTLVALIDCVPQIEKRFSLIVKGTFSDVNLSDNLDYSNYAGLSITNTPLVNKGFSIAASSYTNNDFEAKIVGDGTMGVYRNNSNYTDYRGLKYDFEGNKSIASMKMKLKLMPNGASESTQEVFLFINGQRNNGQAERLLEVRFSCAKSSYVYAYENGNTSVVNLGALPQSGTWFDFEICMNGEDGTYEAFINNQKSAVGKRSFNTNSAITHTLTYFIMNPYRGLTNFSFYMDEMTVCYPQKGIRAGVPVILGEGKVQISVTNTSETPRKATLVGAIYQSMRHELLKVSVDSRLVSGTEILSCDVTVPPGSNFAYFLMDELSTLIPIPIPPAAPENVNAEYQAEGNTLSVKLSWEAAESGSGGIVAYIISKNGAEIGRAAGQALTFTDYGQNVFDEAEYSVRAVNERGRISDASVFCYQSATVYRKSVETVDSVTGRTWHYLDFFGATIVRSYFTQRSWTMDNKRFMFSDNNKYIYVYDTETYLIQKVGELFKNATFVAMTMAPRSSSFYFVNDKKQIAKINMDAQPYSEEVVVQLPAKVWYTTDLGVSDDENVISLDCNVTDASAPVTGRSAWYNVAKDELHLELWHDFTQIDGSGYYSMHTSINPVYTNLLLYCCGGAYTGTPPYRTYTRVWMYDIDTGRDWNFFRQYLYGYTPRGLNYGEENCHETWTCDGEYLVMNKSTVNCVGIPGIVLMNKNGRDRKYVGIPKFQFNGGERSIYLTHPGVSSTNPRWVISDSGAGTASFPKSWPIFLIDVNNAKMEMVVNTPWDPAVGTSDMHPHPSMSQDGNKVIFGVVQSDGIGKIGWMDISDMVSVPQNGQRQNLSASCEALDYAGFEYDLDPEVSNGETVYRIKNGKKMYFDVNNDAVWGVTKDATLNITYLDEGTAPISLEYLVWVDNYSGNPLLSNKLETRSLTINRTGSGVFKTEEFTFYGINLDNMGLLATDMKISGVNSDLVVKSVTVRP